MTDEEAKKILALFRPGTPDRLDPSFTAALERTRPHPPNDRWAERPGPELPHWFQAHCASYLSVRNKFASIPVPPGLKEQILAAGRKDNIQQVSFRPAHLFRIAAIIILCLGLVTFWRLQGRTQDFNTFRTHMARTALQLYVMDLESHDLPAIKTYLAGRQAPADYVLPAGITKAQPVGCAVLHWEGAPVAMLCFHSGRTQSAERKSDLWLFVIDRPSMRHEPAGSDPQVALVKDLATASWIQDGKIYILAAAGDESFLRRYL